MKLLLTQYAPYVPSLGGGNKSNRMALEALAERGHRCHAVSLASNLHGATGRNQLAEELHRHGILSHEQTQGVTTFRLAGVDVSAVWDTSRLCLELMAQIQEFQPDWILVSSEDPGQILLKTALEQEPGRVIYLAHTTLALPFGPDCFAPNEESAALLRRTAGVITVSEYLKQYLFKWGDVSSEVLPILLYGPGPFPQFGSFNRGYITMVNPCAVKGIDIFLELARRMPDLEFAAVISWGTTDEDIAALNSVSNIRLLPSVPDINQILAVTRIVLVPSVWAEGRGRIITEAMASGIPVIGSDSGGIPEAKMGVPYVIPVRRIERYEFRLDGRKVPVAQVPPQDISLWEAAIRELTGNRQHYKTVSQESREVALNYIAGQRIEPVEAFLAALVPKEGAVAGTGDSAAGTDALLCAMSPERRALLARRLQARRSAGTTN
jgi:glycosyltransferase involved in cell wall biosynthesis